MGASSRGGEDSSSYYSSDDEEDALAAGAERGTRRLLHARDHRSSHYATEPLPTATAATSLYPQIHTLATPPVPLAPTMPQVTHTQYGSVSSTSLPSSTRSKPKTKRYRLPFFILLLFDCGLVIFLSIISYDSKRSGFDSPIPKLSYFDMNVKDNYFDLVLLALLRLLLNSLLYLLMGWVTRAVMGLTTLASAVYVPLKAFYCWPITQANDGDFQDVPILLILFVSFVMPWAEAFFFEFKYLPAELSRLRSTSWRQWEIWLWPRALVKDETEDTPSLPDVVGVPPQSHHMAIPRSHSHLYTGSTVSLDFRTPMGSSRNSPIPGHMFGDRSCNIADEDLPPITEETTPSPVHRESPLIRHTLSEEDQRYKMEGERTLHQMMEFTANNDSWKSERTANGILFHSMVWQGKKIWKAECEMAISALQLWNILYPGDQMPQWNPQCTKNESLYRVDGETDVVYSVTSALGPVSSRDFVSLRRILTSDACYVSASVATVYSPMPLQSGKVRAENGPCGYKVVQTGDNSSLFIWVLNTDLKGWLPQTVIDQTLCGVMTATFQKLQTFIEQRRAEGRL
jgi:hypothetical protein